MMNYLAEIFCSVKRLLIVAALITLGAAAFEGRLSIHLPEKAEVPFGDLTLGGFAKLSGSEEAVKEASAIELGSVLSDNFTIRYGVKTIMVHLRSKGFSEEIIDWSGAEIVEIIAKAGDEDYSEHLSAIEIALYDYALEKFPEDQISVVVNSSLPVVLRDHQGSVKVDKPFIPPRGGDVSVPISLIKDNGTQVRAMVRARIDVIREAWVANRRIERGEEFSATDFEIASKPLTVAMNAVNDLNLFENSVAIRPIKQGQVLENSYFRQQPVMRRGQPVSVLFQRGALTMEAAAEALGNAMKGQMISVKLRSTNKVLRGIATGRGTVSVR